MKKTVLIIDDDLNLLESLQRGMHDHADQYSVIISSDSKYFEDVLSKNSVDLVVTDILMPEKDGIEIILEMKRKYPKIKIIAMSGGGLINSKWYLDLAKDLKIDDVLQKPFSKEQLLNVLNNI